MLESTWTTEAAMPGSPSDEMVAACKPLDEIVSGVSMITSFYG